MKSKTILLLSAVILLSSAFTANAQKLKAFGSSIEKKVGPKTMKVPYTDIVSYLGYAEKDSEDEIKDGKKFYYIYVWIPAVAPELGVRMMSPVGKNKIKNPIKAANYDENAGSKAYFDTYITLERSTIITKDGISEEAVQNAQWFTLAKNDDSSEMPKNGGGQMYNSLLRYKSVASDPLKALTVGLYRVGFTTYKKGEVNGTFLAQIGSPVKIPGVEMAKTIKELKEKLAK